jgi:hypothetical protein
MLSRGLPGSRAQLAQAGVIEAIKAFGSAPVAMSRSPKHKQQLAARAAAVEGRTGKPPVLTLPE